MAARSATRTSAGRTWWLFRDEFYWEDEGYDEREVKALILERLTQKDRRLQRAVALMEQTEALDSPRARADPGRGQGLRLAARRRPLREVRQQPAPGVRPRHPGVARRRQHGAQPAAALRDLQPQQGRGPHIAFT